MTTTPALETIGLTKSYGDRAVLRGVDLSAPPGSVLALLGSNGAGKTTIVRILSTLLRADAGTAVVNGYDVATQPDRVRASIGLTGQFAAVDEVLTGRENLVLVAEPAPAAAGRRGRRRACSSGSTSSTRPGAGPRRTRAGCDAVSTWP
ncbi:hypothetical protein GCM10025868_21430 [Angustibacter aerolatus]|uniref:ABC transporter domain-containing protein n=1 Tax=Angustibacter aerolatus TaxID=1162965 RepID=A0ABQ6JFE6_9ACTN|nr:ATP-binding cassette domain-containing protein [Angustibacter aerolatus]GMA86893.1 hypothetical protein GCM10025868_21430 [Angustibacter aerolatus]